MERVRPGVELVLAILAPSRELMVLDLPTFERPRNATSGGPGTGKCRGSEAAVTNWACTFTVQVSGFRGEVASRGKLNAEDTEGTEESKSIELQGALVYVFISDRFVFVPEVQADRDHYTDRDADQEENAGGRQPYEKDDHHACEGDKAEAALQERSGGLGSWVHHPIFSTCLGEKPNRLRGAKGRGSGSLRMTSFIVEWAKK